MTALRKTLTGRHPTTLGVLTSAFLLSGCAGYSRPPERDCFERIMLDARELRVTGRLSWDKWDRLIDLARTGDTRTRCDEAKAIIEGPDNPRPVGVYRRPIADESI